MAARLPGTPQPGRCLAHSRCTTHASRIAERPAGGKGEPGVGPGSWGDMSEGPVAQMLPARGPTQRQRRGPGVQRGRGASTNPRAEGPGQARCPGALSEKHGDRSGRGHSEGQHAGSRQEGGPRARGAPSGGDVVGVSPDHGRWTDAPHPCAGNWTHWASGSGQYRCPLWGGDHLAGWPSSPPACPPPTDTSRPVHPGHHTGRRPHGLQAADGSDEAPRLTEDPLLPSESREQK